jgi:PIN domain nuclease of toxin-antitoxin system
VKDVLLDTHVWIWLSLEQRDRLSQKSQVALKKAKRKWIAAISLWELAKLVEKKKIQFSIPLLSWLNRSLSEQDIAVAHLQPEIAVESCTLEGFHKDPADQMIVATARVLAFPLISADERIRQFQGVKTIW